MAIGLSLQMRNASIRFASYDGDLFRINQGVGPVPIFKFRTRLPFNNGLWFGSEIDGFYASGDVNGDCRIMGSDVTRFINYFKGKNNIKICLHYPTYWLNNDSIPEQIPSGWPNCEN